MSGGVLARVYEIDHKVDPRQEIIDHVAPYLDDIRAVAGPFVLVGVYTREGEQKTKGGIILPDDTGEEDRYQGITGLVLKMGSSAFQTEKTKDWFGDKRVAVGDWVLFDVKHGRSMVIGKRPYRIIQDTYLDMILERPDMAS